MSRAQVNEKRFLLLIETNDHRWQFILSYEESMMWKQLLCKSYLHYFVFDLNYLCKKEKILIRNLYHDVKKLKFIAI